VTALPDPTTQPEPRLLTVSEYAALGETEPGYTELMEGRVLVSPSAVPNHNYASLQLSVQLLPQLPPYLGLLQDVDVDLELAPPDAPGFCRRPDVVILDSAARHRVQREGGLIKASDVSVAIEIVSPGSRRMDHVIKRGEYADAGIPRYWIIDLDSPVSVVVCHLAGEFGYHDSMAVTGTLRVTEPCELTVDLDRLV
jgi:Uma2 family endonuclease